MTYQRVIPRDLFNEADLLKCYGRLWICLDNLRDHKATLGAFRNTYDPGDHTGEAFRIEQSQDDGSTTVANVPFAIDGRRLHLSRPLNSRDPWPLWIDDEQAEICERVFTDEGELSPEFLELIL
jgi:hypothetical protein